MNESSAKRQGYDGIVVAAPVSVPYERFSPEPAHWWLAQALSALGAQTGLTADQIGDSRKYLKEGMEVNVVAWNGSPLEVELPNSVVLEITETDPGVKGDTATGGTKPATLETGAQVMVPLFLSVGEKIKVDTRNDSYLGRENG